MAFHEVSRNGRLSRRFPRRSTGTSGLAVRPNTRTVRKIHPINWRGYLEYGTQMIGDWGIHMMGPANWALQLGSPTSVECTAVEGVNPVTYPNYACKFEFPGTPEQIRAVGENASGDHLLV